MQMIILLNAQNMSWENAYVNKIIVSQRDTI